MQATDTTGASGAQQQQQQQQQQGTTNTIGAAAVPKAATNSQNLPVAKAVPQATVPGALAGAPARTQAVGAVAKGQGSLAKAARFKLGQAVPKSRVEFSSARKADNLSIMRNRVENPDKPDDYVARLQRMLTTERFGLQHIRSPQKEVFGDTATKAEHAGQAFAKKLWWVVGDGEWCV